MNSTSTLTATMPDALQPSGALLTKNPNTETPMPLLESYDLILEDLSRRSQAKTLVMEEAIQRSEWAQRRFWGINE